MVYSCGLIVSGGVSSGAFSSGSSSFFPFPLISGRQCQSWSLRLTSL